MPLELTRHIGVSNFTVALIKGGKGMPAAAAVRPGRDGAKGRLTDLGFAPDLRRNEIEANLRAAMLGAGAAFDDQRLRWKFGTTYGLT